MSDDKSLPVDLMLFLLKGSRDAIHRLFLAQLNEIANIESEIKQLVRKRGHAEAKLMLVEMMRENGEELIVKLAEHFEPQQVLTSPVLEVLPNETKSDLKPFNLDNWLAWRAAERHNRRKAG